MTDPDELGRTLVSIGAALDELGVSWAIGGSVASSVHGEPRATNDVDVIAKLDERQARELTTLLGADFYADADMAADAVRKHSSFNVVDQRTFIKVDVFVPPAGPLGDGQLTRAERIDLVPASPSLPVLGPEDVVLQKLAWYRLGGEVSDRQWRDIVTVLRLSAPDIDDGYLDLVAAATDLETLLARARAATSE